MNKYISLGVLVCSLLSAVNVFAYDVLSSPNTENQYKSSLEEDVEYWCSKRMAEIVEEKKDVEKSKSMFSPEKRAKLAALETELTVTAPNKCTNARQLLGKSRPGALKCGKDFVAFGSKCVSHTENCQLQFGSNISGVASANKMVSECSCNKGFKFDSKNKRCVVPVVETVKSSISEQEERARLLKILAELQAQLAALLNNRR